MTQNDGDAKIHKTAKKTLSDFVWTGCLMVEMQEIPDARLLRDYAEHGTEAAFREIVARHTDLVYSSALRQVNSSALACDLAQTVFTDLARKARSISTGFSSEGSLAGWLCRSTRYAVLNHWRDDRRRTTHERQAMEQLLTDTEPAPDWEVIRPLLDEALDELDDADREVIVLRYFKNQDFRTVGLALGVSDDTAQKRVSRAVERLREFFAKRKVSIGAGGLVTLISANAIQAAPVGLAATLTTTALLTSTAVQTSTLVATTKAIAMTTLQKIVIIATTAALAGAGIYEAKQVSQLRNQVQTLQEAQSPLTNQMAAIEADNARLSNVVAHAKDQKTLSQSQLNELLKLRGQTGQSQTALKELAKMKSENGTTSAFLTNAMAQGMAMSQKIQKKNALAKLTRMSNQLHLTDDQFQSISNLMMARIDASNRQTFAAMQGQPADPIQKLPDEEAEIQALLNPDQLAAYPDFKQSETQLTAHSSASADLTLMMGSTELSQDQQDKAQAALYQYYLNRASDGSSQANAITQARASGNFNDVVNLQMQSQKQELQDKLGLLGGILNPDQLKIYQQNQENMMDMEYSAFKMFMPNTNKPAAE